MTVLSLKLKDITRVWVSSFVMLCKAFTAADLFAPCSEPSVFVLVKSSLDCRLWQWHVYLLESVLLLAGCCERGFLYHGEDPPIIHRGCLPWTSRPFYVTEITSAFFFLRMYQTVYLTTMNVPAISLMGYVLFLKPNNCLFHLYGDILWPHDVSSQQQLPNTAGTLRINSRPFTCLIDVEIMKEPTAVHEMAFESTVQLLMVAWKRGGIEVL